MAQTELMLRLLLARDHDSPSGYRIVGFEHHKNGRITHQNDNEWWDIVTAVSMITFDAFEQGVETKNGWVFDGDIFQDNYDGEKWILKYSSDGWYLKSTNGKRMRFDVLYHLDDYNRVGTIHDKE